MAVGVGGGSVGRTAVALAVAVAGGVLVTVGGGGEVGAAVAVVTVVVAVWVTGRGVPLGAAGTGVGVRCRCIVPSPQPTTTASAAEKIQYRRQCCPACMLQQFTRSRSGRSSQGVLAAANRVVRSGQLSQAHGGRSHQELSVNSAPARLVHRRTLGSRHSGGVAEWLKAPVLKTGSPKRARGFESLPLRFSFRHLSGARPAACAGRKRGTANICK